jgi:tRNA (cmo5U34)-methyltransferase
MQAIRLSQADDSVDLVMPKGKWQFDGDVTEVFDNMLERSIPQYEIMRQACLDLACRYQKPNTWIVDLGCSRGEAMAPLIDRFGARNHFLGIDVSDAMLEAARARFKGLIDCGVVEIRRLDLRKEFPPVSASVILCVLTLQFTPIEYRLRIMQDIYDNLIDGGAFILVEKVLGASAKLDGAMTDIYYGMKAANGYTQEQIERKRLSLEGVLVPITARMNEDMLGIVGFRQIDCFWRWFNFAGWIAVK